MREGGNVMLDDGHPAWEKHSGKDWHRGPEWQPGDTSLAEAFYSSVPPSTQLFLDVLMDRPGEQASADELAQCLRPRKPGETATGHRRAVAATIRPMEGPAAELGRRFPFYWWKGAGGSPAGYAMKPFEAQLFRDARHKITSGSGASAHAGQATGTDARALLESLAGQQILTITGQPNTVLAIAGQHVLVATDRSPAGQPVSIESVQSGLDRLQETGEVEISTASLGHRSSFIGAVLRTLPAAALIPVTPPRIRLADPATARRLSEAGSIHTWWAGDPQQRFWLEITDRPDIGVDLHCPQRDATGSRTPGYSLIWSVEPGDVIFHYSRPERAIVAWSRVSPDA